MKSKTCFIFAVTILLTGCSTPAREFQYSLAPIAFEGAHQKPQKVLSGCRKAAILGVDPNVIFKGQESTQESGSASIGLSEIGGVGGIITGGVLGVSTASNKSKGSIKYETEDVNLNKRLFVFNNCLEEQGYAPVVQTINKNWRFINDSPGSGRVPMLNGFINGEKYLSLDVREDCIEGASIGKAVVETFDSSKWGFGGAVYLFNLKKECYDTYGKYGVLELPKP